MRAMPLKALSSELEERILGQLTENSEFVKKWGLAPAQLYKTLTLSTIGRCLSPFFHKL